MDRKTEPTAPAPIRGDADQASPRLFLDERDKAEREAANSLRQFDRVLELIDEVERTGEFKLRPSTIQELHRIAIDQIYSCAGNFRTKPIFIRGSSHTPPPWEQVPRLVEEACEYVTGS